MVKKKSYTESLTYKVGTIEPKYVSSGELYVSMLTYTVSVDTVMRIVNIKIKLIGRLILNQYGVPGTWSLQPVRIPRQ